MKTILTLLCAVTLTALSVSFAFASGEVPAKAQDHPIVLKNAVIHTGSGATIDGGMIVFDKGKITAIGTSVAIPQGAEIIDLKGQNVYPGFIDGRSNIGLTEIGAVRATNDINESGDVNPNLRPEVAINPESELIPVTRANGITMAVTMPSGGLISGMASLALLDGWTWEDMTFKAPVGLVMSWPSMTINHAWWERRSEDDQKKERDKQLDQLRQIFSDARSYMKAKLAEGNNSVPYHPHDAKLEAMIPVLQGKIPVFVDAEEVQQIEAAIAWADKEQVKLVIMGGYDAWRVTDLLKAHDVSVIVNPVMRLPWRRFEEYDQAQLLPKKLFEAGVHFCIAGEGGASNERNLPYQAAMAVGHGLPKDEAMKAITINAAQIFGVSDRVGSLEVGKDATIIVSDGDPLEIASNITMEFMQGKNIQLTSRHTRFYEKYKTKYEQEDPSKLVPPKKIKGE